MRPPTNDPAEQRFVLRPPRVATPPALHQQQQGVEIIRGLAERPLGVQFGDDDIAVLALGVPPSARFPRTR